MSSPPVYSRVCPSDHSWPGQATGAEDVFSHVSDTWSRGTTKMPPAQAQLIVLLYHDLFKTTRRCLWWLPTFTDLWRPRGEQNPSHLRTCFYESHLDKPFLHRFVSNLLFPKYIKVPDRHFGCCTGIDFRKAAILLKIQNISMAGAQQPGGMRM